MSKISLYNILFGKNPWSSILLKMLNLSENDFGRLRDVYLIDGKIVVYTRNGGGNREHWDCLYSEYDEGPNCPCPGCKMKYVIPRHPNYIQDYDDNYDSTYAYIEFSMPKRYRELVSFLRNKQSDVLNVSEKFQTLINELLKEPKKTKGKEVI